MSLLLHDQQGVHLVVKLYSHNSLRENTETLKYDVLIRGKIYFAKLFPLNHSWLPVCPDLPSAKYLSLFVSLQARMWCQVKVVMRGINKLLPVLFIHLRSGAEI